MRMCRLNYFKMLLVILLITEGSAVLAEDAKVLKWESVRSARQKEIKEYYASNPEEFKYFTSGALGEGPFPAIIVSMLPELLPDLWGPPSGHMESVGFSKNVYGSNHNLPLGFGMESVSLEKVIGESGKGRQLNMAGYNCVACHTGKVEVAPGEIKTMLGAPNGRMTNLLFLFARTVTHPDFTADKILANLQAKPVGSIYGNSSKERALEELDRKVFMEEGVAKAIVDSLRARGQGMLGGFEKYIRPRTYDAPGQRSPDPYAVKRGTMDAILSLHLSFISLFSKSPEALEAELPKFTAEVDIPSIWLQRNTGKIGHWDGDHLQPLYRNVGAATASLNNNVSVKKINGLTGFIQDLPSEPYPFAVNLVRAQRGEVLFQKGCLSCHGDENKVFPIEKLGTSRNRIDSFTPVAADFLGKAHLSLCTDEKLCLKNNGERYLNTEIAQKTQGYVGGPLDGIWARAPYLHNGSVPTLYALLTGERPKVFFRGNMKYDQRYVGFNWKSQEAGAVVYDTTLSGNSNLGHAGFDYLGFDPKKEPEKLWDLLEYLKTL